MHLNEQARQFACPDGVVADEGGDDIGRHHPQIKKSVTPDALISFVDGKPYRTLKRHLSVHGLTLNEQARQFACPDGVVADEGGDDIGRHHQQVRRYVVEIAKPTPAQIKKSVTPDALISFVDGKPYRTLKRSAVRLPGWSCC
jgi:predicted transcriptional regulator